MPILPNKHAASLGASKSVRRTLKQQYQGLDDQGYNTRWIAGDAAHTMLESHDSSALGSMSELAGSNEASRAFDLSLAEQERIRLPGALEVEDHRQAEGHSRGQTETLVRTLSILAKEPTLNGLLGHVLRAIAEQLRAQGATLWIRDPETDRPVLRLCYEGGVIQYDADAKDPVVLRPPCLRDDPSWQEMARTGRPVLYEDIATDPRDVPYRECLLGKGVRSLLEVPLLHGAETIGMISIRSRNPGDYDPQAVELAQALTYQATLAIQLTRLAETAQETAVLAERNRIAQEIHDGLAQNFTGILMQLEAAEESGAFSRRSRVELFASRVRELAREGLAESRRSVMALRPAHSRRGGLDKALRELSERTNAPGSVTCVYRRFGDKALSPDKEHALFRIAQEAVSNALRHARPSNIFLSLHESAEYWELSVLDDGIGMAQSPEYYARQGFGLESMRERARAAGGSWHISSRPGEGTCITVRVAKQIST